MQGCITVHLLRCVSLSYALSVSHFLSVSLMSEADSCYQSLTESSHQPPPSAVNHSTLSPSRNLNSPIFLCLLKKYVRVRVRVRVPVCVHE